MFADKGIKRAPLGARMQRRPQNFHSHLIEELGSRIAGGVYPEGSILPGNVELLDEFGVSRTVLREAIRTLSAKGLLESRARVGTRVLPRSRWNMFDSDVLTWHVRAGISTQFIAFLSEVRMAVEPEAAALGAIRRTEEQAQRISHWFEQMARSDQTSEEFALNDLEFHRMVALASDNPFMISLSSVIEIALATAFTISSPVEDENDFELAVRLHRRIAEAIVEKEPDIARIAMRQAIQSGIDRAVAALQNGLK